MALVGNHSVLNKSAGRWLAGGVHAKYRSNYNRNSDWRNFSLQHYSTPSTVLAYAARPQGYYPQGVYALPSKAGGVTAINKIFGTGTLTAAGAMGLPGTSDITGTGTLTATGQLVVSGASDIVGTGALIGNILAALLGDSAITATGTLTSTMRADGYANSTLNGAGTLAITSYAVGYMASDIGGAAPLSAEGLALSLLDDQLIETGMTMRQALRLISAAVAGKVSGGGTTTITFRNAVVDSKNRIVATVDSNGNRTAITYDST